MTLEQSLWDRPVASLQHMLRRLSMEVEVLPRLTVDGRFGEETLEAVMIFQREFHPPVTGVVDRGTWQAIRDRWLEAEQRLGHPRATRLFPGERTQVDPDQVREFLIIPQAMFQVLGHHLDGVNVHPADGFHGPASADNVRWLQRAAGQPETGILDRAAWEMLSRLYEVLVVRELEEEAAEFQGGWG